MKINSEKEIQKKISSIYYSDGFIDISFGIATIFYIFIHNSTGWVKYLLFGILFAITIPLRYIKKAVAFPRVGVMIPDFRNSRSTKVVKRILLILILCSLIGFVFSLNLPPTDIQNPEIVFDVLILFPFVLYSIIIAVVVKVYRLSIHMGLICGGFILYFYLESIDLQFYGYLAMILIGILIISVGLVYLIRFLRNNPIMRVEKSDDNQK